MEYIPHKEYFKKYRSNTHASTSNNYMLIYDEEKTITGRIFYKVIRSGKFNYRFLFSNVTDSTFSNGSVSRANTPGDEFEILSAYAGCCSSAETGEVDAECLKSVCFDGNTSKKVGKGEVYWCDEIELDIGKDQYLVFEWTVRGKRMAYTPDKLIPSFVKDENGIFVKSCDFPQPQLIGCDAEFKKNILFLGDSITMGCGTTVDRYAFWAAHIGRGLGKDYSVWNIGLGFGRAQDAATDGIWLEKAKQYDTAIVCLGVNDMHQRRSCEQLKEALTTVVDRLTEAGITLCLFTIPAFSWEGEFRQYWDDVNDLIANVLAKRADYFFDMAEASGNAENRYLPLDGINGHPTDAGCAHIGDEFLKKYSSL